MPRAEGLFGAQNRGICMESKRERVTFLASQLLKPQPTEEDILEEQKQFANVLATFQQYATYSVSPQQSTPSIH